MLIGTISNICGYAAASKILTNLADQSFKSIKAVDKVAIPVGIFIISSIVGDKCQEYTEDKVNSVKKTMNEIIELRNALNEQREKCEEFSENVDVEYHNIFDDSEEVQDGDSTNA